MKEENKMDKNIENLIGELVKEQFDFTLTTISGRGIGLSSLGNVEITIPILNGTWSLKSDGIWAFELELNA